MLRNWMMSLAVLLFSGLARAEPVTLDGTEQWTMHSAEAVNTASWSACPRAMCPGPVVIR